MQIDVCIIIVMMCLFCTDPNVWSCYWHHPHSMWSRVYTTVGRLSVCTNMGPQQQTRCCRYSVCYCGPSGQEILINCSGQCHVVSIRRKLNSFVSVAVKFRIQLQYAIMNTSYWEHHVLYGILHHCHINITQPFNDPLSGTTRMGRYQKKNIRPSWSSDILYQLPSTKICSILLVQFTCFSTTSLQVLFGLPLSLRPSTSYSTYFFTQSLSSFHNTCPYHHNLFCCSTGIMSLFLISLSSLLGFSVKRYTNLPLTYKQNVTEHTWETILEMSPEFDGSKTVFVSLARLENAAMYCSATVMDTAFNPCWQQPRHINL